MSRTILYATSNTGKILEVSRHLSPLGIDIVSPKQLKIEVEVAESGQTLEENAWLKARAYHELAPDHIVLADDTGLEISALNGEPGVFVRRWRDRVHDMTDEEIIEYTLERMSNVSPDDRGAQFRTVMAVIFPDGREAMVDGILRGQIIPEWRRDVHIPGLPFEGLFYVPEWGYLLGETRAMSPEDKTGFLSHRERAVEKVQELLKRE